MYAASAAHPALGGNCCRPSHPAAGTAAAEAEQQQPQAGMYLRCALAQWACIQQASAAVVRNIRSADSSCQVCACATTNLTYQRVPKPLLCLMLTAYKLSISSPP